jgi:Na+-translocating ferredoxin:NAD+ oxidoreductase RnfA subunit
MAEAHNRTDRGLARERTVLAWYRLGLAAVVCIAVLLRRVWPLHTTDQVVALGLVAAAAVLWALVLLAFAARAPGADAGAPMRPQVAWLITAATVTLAAVGFVLALFPPP